MQDEVIVVEAPVIEEAANPENEAVAAEFEEVKADVAAGREPSRSVRELLRWFGARRRRGGVVERIEADELPSETEFVSSLDARRKAEKVPPLEATEEQLKAFQARNAGPAPASAPAAPATPATAYPPLEPTGTPQ